MNVCVCACACVCVCVRACVRVCVLSLSPPSRSYVCSSLASAAVSFATGAFGMWIPLYLYRAQVVQKTAEVCTKDICSSKDRWDNRH